MSDTTTLINKLRNGCGDVECEDCQFSRKPYRMDFDCTLCEQAADAIEWLEAQLAAIRAEKEQANKPLTLDELRKMDGEPVWIVEHPNWGHWELSEYAEDYLEDRDPDFYGMKYNDPDGRYGLHILGWLAFRRKPEQED